MNFICYNFIYMEKNILIAGKDMVDGGSFAEGCSVSGRLVAISGAEPDADDSRRRTIAERRADVAAYEEARSIEAKAGICTIEWNRSSPLSARSFVLEAESIYGRIDEAVLLFDEEWFASSAEKLDAEEIARVSDYMTVGFQYLALELISKFERANSAEQPSTLVFMLKEGPCTLDVMKVPALKTGVNAIASPLVAAAAASFASFAENIAALYADSRFVNILLVRSDPDSDVSGHDDQLSRWLCSYMDELCEKKNVRHSVQWIKSGAKVAQSPFSLFRR